MPELPDVEILKRLFDRHALGQVIQQVIVKDARILSGVDQHRFVDEIAGRRFEQTRRHGKHLFAKLHKDGWLAMHFGMSGGLSFFEAPVEEPPYTQVRFDFANGNHLAYTSRRILGRLDLTADVAAFIRDRGLGSVDVSSQEQACGGEMDESEVAPGELFEAGEDTSIVFHISEHDLDFVAFFIEGPVGFASD